VSGGQTFLSVLTRLENTDRQECLSSCGEKCRLTYGGLGATEQRRQVLVGLDLGRAGADAKLDVELGVPLGHLVQAAAELAGLIQAGLQP